MGLISEPIFYNSIRRNSGAKRKMIHISNTEDVKVVCKVVDMEKPEWLELEGIYPGIELEFKKNAKMPLVVNINTAHRYFPSEPIRDHKVKLTLESEQLGEVVVDIGITIPEVIDLIEPFRGVFSVDFGTTNSCFAYKGSSADSRGSRGGEDTKVSREIPTLIFFHDVSDNFMPKYTVGNEARQDITENSSQVYSYVMSIKRRLGMDKRITMLDRLSGARPDHRQEWHVEEIAAFIIRELINRAEDELEKKIVQNVVATFPPLFSMDRKRSIRTVFHRAFADHGNPLSEDNLVMILDEANAAAFNYIYRVMLQELRDFRIARPGEREWVRANLLSYDFGGGTIDISVVYVEVERVQGGRIEIRTELKGVSGEPNYGGDNVTLAVFQILKIRLAQTVAASIMDEIKAIEKAKAEEEASQKEEEEAEVDIWAAMAAGMAGGQEEEEASVWDDDEEEKDEQEEEEEEEEPIDPELEGIENPDVSVQDDKKIYSGEYEQAVRTVVDFQKVLVRQVDTGKPLLDLMIDFQKENGSYSGQTEAKRETERLDRAVETLVPTRSKAYENENPRKEQIAQRLFQELWQEADLLKIRCAVSSLELENDKKKSGAEPEEIQKVIWSAKSPISSTLKRISHYTSVDALKFNDIEVNMEQIENWIDDKVGETVRKAHALFKGIEVGLSESASQEKDSASGDDTAASGGGLTLKPKPASGGLKLKIGGSASSGSGESARISDQAQNMADVKLRVLLFGNSSNLPIVRRKFREIFKNDVDETNLIFDPVNLKSAVASGACEEYTLRKIFGGGLIKYSPAGFLEKLPFSYGLFHRDLEFAGFQRGYAPVFQRGDKIGKTVLLSQDKFFMVNPTAPDLALYSDYKDNSDFQYVGFFDFQAPDDFDEICRQMKENVPPPPDRFAELNGKSHEEVLQYVEQNKDSLPPHELDQVKQYAREVGLWVLDNSLFDEIDKMVADVVSAGESENSYRVAMRLLPTREVLCVRVKDRAVFMLKVEPFDIDKVENPFSGTW